VPTSTPSASCGIATTPRCNVAAERGAVDLARLLLDAGADPGVRDDKYDATVLGWAEYCGQPAIAELLRERGVSV
jgi:ankyrin repeat protein